MAEKGSKGKETQKNQVRQEEQTFNPKWLKGLIYETSEARTVKEQGENKKRWVPVERELKESDVLSWREKDKFVIIVTKDGKKHVVRK